MSGWQHEVAVELAALARTVAAGVDGFAPASETLDVVERLCSGRTDAVFEVLGESEEGRPIGAVRIGSGRTHISLIAGNHADEPVGPTTLRHLLVALLEGHAEQLLEHVRFFIVPHTNPDGEVRNLPWITRWPDVLSFVRQAVREAPGRDLEFGFPDLRVENRIVSVFLRRHAPFSLHMSLHGMAFAEGAMLLIDRTWAPHTISLQRRFRSIVEHEGFRMHDHNRRGEKGFFYIAPGYWTTPEGDSMRAHFQMLGDAETAACFRDSSMEYVQSLGGRPLCVVTELPLFVVRHEPGAESGEPVAYLRFRQALEASRRAGANDDAVTRMIADFEVTPLPLREAVRLQLSALALSVGRVLGLRNEMFT